MVDLGPLSPMCLHSGAVPVEDLGGERVATLCPDCNKQLPAEWQPEPPSYSRLFFDPSLVSDTRLVKRWRRR